MWYYDDDHVCEKLRVHTKLATEKLLQNFTFFDLTEDENVITCRVAFTQPQIACKLIHVF